MRKLLFALAALTLSIVVLTGSPRPAQACACCGTWQVTGVESWDVLNIRSGPGARFTIVGEIPSGSACVIKTGTCRNNWCHVSYADFEGWVSNRYLRWKR